MITSIVAAVGGAPILAVLFLVPRVAELSLYSVVELYLM